MKKKWKVPILLMAAVVMLSIFYIMDGNKNQIEPAGSDDYVVSSLNPEFTEYRIEANKLALEEIEKLEEDLASGTLDQIKTKECLDRIDDIKHTKASEVSLEEAIIAEFSLSDALVVIDKENKEIVIDVYSKNNDASLKNKFVEVAILALNLTDLNYQVKLLDMEV